MGILRRRGVKLFLPFFNWVLAMPATGCRVTMIFQDDILAISETHNRVTVTDIASAVNDAKNLVKARMRCMGEGVVFVECRLSMEGVWRDSFIISAADMGPLGTQSGILTSGVQLQEPASPDQAKSCLLLRLQATPQQHRPLYAAGIPDAVIGENPRENRAQNFPQFWQALTAYMDYLTSGLWGSVFRPLPTGTFTWFKSSGYANDANTGLFGFDMLGATATFNVGDKVQLRNFAQVNRAYATPNGQWQIQSILVDMPIAGTNRYLLFGSSGVAATTVKLPGYVQRIDFSTVQYQSWTLLGQTTRKRGNRLLAGPGRRLIRKRISA